MDIARAAYDKTQQVDFDGAMAIERLDSWIDGFEGTVELIETRATIIKTYDGKRVVIPNSDIYTNAVLVKTAHQLRRSQYDEGFGR